MAQGNDLAAREMRLRSLRKWYIIWFLILLVIDVVVPFAFLTNVQSVAGAFLFWTVWAIVAIVTMFSIFLRWRD